MRTSSNWSSPTSSWTCATARSNGAASPSPCSRGNSACWNSDPPSGSGGHPHHAAGRRVGLSLRPPDRGDRRADQPPAPKDRQGPFPAPDPYRARRRLYGQPGRMSVAARLPQPGLSAGLPLRPGRGGGHAGGLGDLLFRHRRIHYRNQSYAGCGVSVDMNQRLASALLLDGFTKSYAGCGFSRPAISLMQIESQPISRNSAAIAANASTVCSGLMV